MPKQYTREELWKLYQKLPKELQEVIFAGETADHISNICERYNIKEETISEIAKQVGNVLLGISPPDELQAILEKELKLEKGTAKKVAQEINRFVFYPVKPALEQLYKIGVASSEEEIKRPTIEKTEEKQTRPAREDIYKEPIE